MAWWCSAIWVSPKERGRYYTYFSIVYTTAGGSGPCSAAHRRASAWSVIFLDQHSDGACRAGGSPASGCAGCRVRTAASVDIVAPRWCVASVLHAGIERGGVRYAWSSLPILALFRSPRPWGRCSARLMTARTTDPISVLQIPSALRDGGQFLHRAPSSGSTCSCRCTAGRAGFRPRKQGLAWWRSCGDERCAASPGRCSARAPYKLFPCSGFCSRRRILTLASQAGKMTPLLPAHPDPDRRGPAAAFDHRGPMQTSCCATARHLVGTMNSAATCSRPY